MSKLLRSLYDCFVDSRGSRRFDFKLANSWRRLLQIVLGRALLILITCQTFS